MSDLKCRPRLSARENSSLHTPHFTVPLDLNIMSCASYSKKSVRIINTLWNTLCRNLVVDIDLTSVFLIQPLPPPSSFLPPPSSSPVPTPSTSSYSIASLHPLTHSLCFARRALRASSAFSPENFLLKRKFPPSSSSLARDYWLLGLWAALQLHGITKFNDFLPIWFSERSFNQSCAKLFYKPYPRSTQNEKAHSGNIHWSK